MVIERFSETLVRTYESTWHQNPEQRHTHRHVNLKYQTAILTDSKCNSEAIPSEHGNKFP
jgi:hypothetical protein